MPKYAKVCNGMQNVQTMQKCATVCQIIKKKKKKKKKKNMLKYEKLGKHVKVCKVFNSMPKYAKVCKSMQKDKTINAKVLKLSKQI